MKGFETLIAKGFKPFKGLKFKVDKNIVRAFGDDLPPTASVILQWAIANKKSQGMLAFSVRSLPPSANSMYEQGADQGSRRRSDEYNSFIREVSIGIGAKRYAWKPKGAVMAMIFLQTPEWVTKQTTMREMDVDNRVKTLLDSIQLATDIPDHTNWELHVYKVWSSKVQTSVYLFDLGLMIDFHP